MWFPGVVMAGIVVSQVYQSDEALLPGIVSVVVPWGVSGVGGAPSMLAETVVLVLTAVVCQSRKSTAGYVPWSWG